MNGAQPLGFNTSQTSNYDIQISLHDGQQFGVSLKGWNTLQDVITAIKTPSGGGISVAIDTTNHCLQLTDNTTGGGTFSVTALNGSLAGAAQVGLGILGSENGGGGIIEGASLSGDSLSNHLFLSNASINASATLLATNLGATASFGLIGIGINGGMASANAEVDAKLNASAVGSTNGRISASELSAALSSVSIQLLGSATMNLPATIQTSLFSLPSQASTTLVVRWPDINDSNGITLRIDSPGTVSQFQQLKPSDIRDAFYDVVGALQTMDKSSVLSNALPLLNEGVSSLVQTASALGQALDQTTINTQELLNVLVGDFAAGIGYHGGRVYRHDKGHGTKIPIYLHPHTL